MFLYNYYPNSVLLDLGFFHVRWYGVIIALAVASGFLVFYKLYCCVGTMHNIVQQKNTTISGNPNRTLQCNVPTDIVYNIFFYIIIFSIIGARLFHILSFYKYYSQHLLEIFYIWNGGLSFYGAFITGLLVMFYFSKDQETEKLNARLSSPDTAVKKKFTNKPFITLLLYYFITLIKSRVKNFLILIDIAVIALSLSQSIGRWGNYFNQELFGKPCDYFWCIPIQNLSGHFHPVFLYESLLMLLVFFILLFIFKKKYILGFTSALYLILHASIRFGLEFLRLDIQPEFLNLRLFQYIAVLEFLAGIILLIFVKKWYNKKVI
ncbi:MAG: prolipoprotein diacylglyceryl transferase [Patescibacteria group bacterium]